MAQANSEIKYLTPIAVDTKKKKYCRFKKNRIKYIDYKDADFLLMIVFTNNMLTAINAINYGIATHCTGGFSVDRSAVLSGAQAYRAVAEIHPDIFFFSSKSLSKAGIISDPISEENYIRTLMLKNAKFSVFLCDSEKFDTESLYQLTSIDEIDACVFDKPFPELKAKCQIFV